MSLDRTLKRGHRTTRTRLSALRRYPGYSLFGVGCWTFDVSWGKGSVDTERRGQGCPRSFHRRLASPSVAFPGSRNDECLTPAAPCPFISAVEPLK